MGRLRNTVVGILKKDWINAGGRRSSESLDEHRCILVPFPCDAAATGVRCRNCFAPRLFSEAAMPQKFHLGNINVGLSTNLQATDAAPDAQTPFRILIMGDFSGRA